VTTQVQEAGRDTVLTRARWQERATAHEERVEAWLAHDREQRQRYGQHAVGEFLYTYYSHRPARLRRWQPGHGTALDDAREADFGPFHTTDDQGRVVVDATALLDRRRHAIGWIHRLLTATANRPAQLGCFGMHEWAMVYRQPEAETRHHALPLRLGAAGTAEVVEGTPIRCSHYDAYRFFTPAARPRNEFRPTRDSQIEFEQPGCLHANMDVYRWAYKLSPLVSGELVADCFALAREIRTLDMRASPYDLTAQGLTAIAVETVRGRAEYARQQRAFAERAAVLRGRLIGVTTAILR
jgi:hypothetical protein